MGKTTKPTPSAPSRFVRSVNLEHDLWRPDALDGYVVTAGVRRALAARRTGDNRRSCKSGLDGDGALWNRKVGLRVVFGLAVQSRRDGPRSAARGLLRACDKDLAAKILGGAGAEERSVAGCGHRFPRATWVGTAPGFAAVAEAAAGRQAAAFRRKIEALYTDAKGGKLPATTELTALFRECLDSVCEGKDAPDGLLLVIDELGKLLEHATTHTDKSDIFILQSLAEFAARSSQPFLIIGVLHQDFSLYAQQLSPRRPRRSGTKSGGGSKISPLKSRLTKSCV